MSLILNIETAVEAGSVCLSQNENLLGYRQHEHTKEHAAWLHTAIKETIDEAGVKLNSIDAVAVSNGPGSYTGLRIGLTAAKGICYALQKPLITIGTLEIMTAALINKNETINKSDWFCPMIDARRMEAYFAVYDYQLTNIYPPSAGKITIEFLQNILAENKIILFGNGSNKFSSQLIDNRVSFIDFSRQTAKDMIKISHKMYNENLFAELAYAEPFYVKDFYTGDKK